MIILWVWGISSFVGWAVGEFIVRVLFKRRAVKVYGPWVKNSGWFK